MNPFEQQGAFSWCELMTADPAAARDFYGSLLGWTLKEGPLEGVPYTVVQVDGKEVGGLMGMPPEAPPMPPAWGVYVTVDNVDKTAQKAQELGGTVLMPPTDISTVGRFCLIQDPQGATFYAITYGTP
jgi:predicted enzyme related to lactoylglutathione lyase